MARTKTAWIGAAVAFLAVGLLWVWAPAAVAVSVVGLVISFVGMMMFNVPLGRAAYFAALAARVGIVYAVSASFWLVGAVVCAHVLVPHERMVRRFGEGNLALYFLPTVSTAALFALGWSVGPARWAVVPDLVLAALGTAMGIRGHALLKGYRRSVWNVKVGETVPEFELPSRTGEIFQLSAARGRYVLLCFVRGDWCPVCQIKMRIYQKEAARLAESNVKVIVVSPTVGPDARSFAHDMGVDSLVLEDEANQVARIFGALQAKAFKGSDAPLPSSFLIDPDGKLCHASSPNDLESFMDPRKIFEFLKSPNVRPAAA